MTAHERSLPCSIGLDVGGTKTLGVLVDSTDAVIASVRLPTDTARPHGVVRTMHQVIDRLLGDAGVHEHELSSIGVGIPGRVDHVRGEVSFALNLGIGKGALKVATAISGRYHVDVHVENDVNAAALGAYFLLRDPAVADISYVSLGTGLAAGLVLGGKLRRGATGVAGEIGHFPLDPLGELCDCGLRGCLEAVASGSAIARRWPGDGTTTPARHLFEAAAEGDPKALRIRDSVLDQLARAILMIVLTVDPDRVVLGGGVAEVGSPLIDGVRSSVRALCRQSPFLDSLDVAGRTVPVVGTVPAGAIGAALLGRSSS